MQCISIGPYGERYTPNEWDFPNITRPFSIVYYALGGSAFYTVDGVERPFEKGHLYIFPANRVYSLREDKRDKFYLMFVHAFTSPEIDFASARASVVLPVPGMSSSRTCPPAISEMTISSI